MTETHRGEPGGVGEPDYVDDGVTGWVAWVLFAGIMMFMIGAFHAIAGLVALFDDEYYLVRPSGLILEFDYTAWGWIHLLFGLFVVAVGLGTIAGQTWARALAVVLAGASALINLLFLGAYPWWSVIIIALDVLVIYALVVHGREVRLMR